MDGATLDRVRALEAGLRAQERLSAGDQRAVQGQLLGGLLRHAAAHSAFWRARLAAAGIGPEGPAAGAEMAALARLPVLSRAELQDHFDAMRARGPGQGPEQILAAATSGSTGRPVRVEYLARARALLQFAMARRADAWHGRDATRPLAVIADTPDGARLGWRPDLVAEGQAGRVVSRNVMAEEPQALWRWLAGQGADYLTTSVAMARALAEAALAAPGHGVRLREVISYGERVDDEVRDLVATAFGARLTSIYGCQEASWLALQCPVHPHFHVMSASAIVEVVRDDDSPCAAGEPGRVLVTALHSQVMPLVRYELGDMAELGAEGVCDCGVGLPVLARVHGRARSFLRMSDGTLRLARITGEHWREAAPVQEARLVQYGDGLVEAFVRCPRPLSEGERAGLEAMLRRVLDPGLQLVLSEVDRIDWPAGWKREDVTRVDGLREGQGS